MYWGTFEVSQVPGISVRGSAGLLDSTTRIERPATSLLPQSVFLRRKISGKVAFSFFAIFRFLIFRFCKKISFSSRSIVPRDIAHTTCAYPLVYSCPQLAKGDMGALSNGAGLDPKPTCAPIDCCSANLQGSLSSLVFPCWLSDRASL
jgi:hypothetical protein